MEYRGYELENIPCDTSKTGREYLAYKDDCLVGGSDDFIGITTLIDQLIKQGVSHESMLKEVK